MAKEIGIKESEHAVVEGIQDLEESISEHSGRIPLPKMREHLIAEGLQGIQKSAPKHSGSIPLPKMREHPMAERMPDLRDIVEGNPGSKALPKRIRGSVIVKDHGTRYTVTDRRNKASCNFMDGMLNCFSFQENASPNASPKMARGEIPYVYEDELTMNSLNLSSKKMQRKVFSGFHPSFKEDFLSAWDHFVPVSFLFDKVAYVLYATETYSREGGFHINMDCFDHTDVGLGEQIGSTSFRNKEIRPESAIFKLSNDKNYPLYVFDSACSFTGEFTHLFQFKLLFRVRFDCRVEYQMVSPGLVDIDFTSMHYENRYSSNKILARSQSGNLVFVNAENVMYEGYHKRYAKEDFNTSTEFGELSYLSDVFYCKPDKHEKMDLFNHSLQQASSLHPYKDATNEFPIKLDEHRNNYFLVRFVEESLLAVLYKSTENEFVIELSEENEPRRNVDKITFNYSTSNVPVALLTKTRSVSVGDGNYVLSADITLVTMTRSRKTGMNGPFMLQVIHIDRNHNMTGSVCREFPGNILSDIDDFSKKVMSALSVSENKFDHNVSPEKKVLCDLQFTKDQKPIVFSKFSNKNVTTPFNFISEKSARELEAKFINAEQVLMYKKAILQPVIRILNNDIYDGYGIFNYYGESSCSFSDNKMNCFALEKNCSSFEDRKNCFALEKNAYKGKKFVMSSLDLLSGKKQRMVVSDFPQGIMGKFFQDIDSKLYLNHRGSEFYHHSSLPTGFSPLSFLFEKTAYAFYEALAEKCHYLTMDAFEYVNAESGRLIYRKHFPDKQISAEFAVLEVSSDPKYPFYMWDKRFECYRIYKMCHRFKPLFRIEQSGKVKCKIVPAELLGIDFIDNYSSDKAVLRSQDGRVAFVNKAELMYSGYDVKHCSLTPEEIMGLNTSITLSEEWNFLSCGSAKNFLKVIPKAKTSSSKPSFDTSSHPSNFTTSHKLIYVESSFKAGMEYSSFYPMSDESSLLLYKRKGKPGELFIEEIDNNHAKARSVSKIDFSNDYENSEPLTEPGDWDAIFPNCRDYAPLAVLTTPNGGTILLNVDRSCDNHNALLIQAIHLTSDHKISKALCIGFSVDTFNINDFLKTVNAMLTQKDLYAFSLQFSRFCKTNFEENVANNQAAPLKLVEPIHHCASPSDETLKKALLVFSATRPPRPDGLVDDKSAINATNKCIFILRETHDREDVTSSTTVVLEISTSRTTVKQIHRSTDAEQSTRWRILGPINTEISRVTPYYSGVVSPTHRNTGSSQTTMGMTIFVRGNQPKNPVNPSESTSTKVPGINTSYVISKRPKTEGFSMAPETDASRSRRVRPTHRSTERGQSTRRPIFQPANPRVSEVTPYYSGVLRPTHMSIGSEQDTVGTIMLTRGYASKNPVNPARSTSTKVPGINTSYVTKSPTTKSVVIAPETDASSITTVKDTPSDGGQSTRSIISTLTTPETDASSITTVKDTPRDGVQSTMSIISTLTTPETDASRSRRVSPTYRSTGSSQTTMGMTMLVSGYPPKNPVNPVEYTSAKVPGGTIYMHEPTHPGIGNAGSGKDSALLISSVVIFPLALLAALSYAILLMYKNGWFKRIRNRIFGAHVNNRYEGHSLQKNSLNAVSDAEGMGNRNGQEFAASPFLQSAEDETSFMEDDLPSNFCHQVVFNDALSPDYEAAIMTV